ncbi:MAG: hypothetical protein K0R33_4518, partial [Mycobacterium sp.]|nr:hypothetical protein [Mycobacterium sp.]
TESPTPAPDFGDENDTAGGPTRRGTFPLLTDRGAKIK